MISGGNSGIGRAVAALFAREGADVAITYLSERKDAEETATAVRAEGQRAILIEGDVASRDFCREAVARTVDELGALDVLVNNAAFQVHTASADWQRSSIRAADIELKSSPSIRARLQAVLPPGDGCSTRSER